MFSPDHDAQLRRVSLRLGLRNGLLIGLALGLGTWGPGAIDLSTARVRLAFSPLLLGLAALLLLGGLGGWLAAWRGSALGGVIVWALVAISMTWVIGHLPYEGGTLTVWLADRRFWGLPIYPFSPAAQARLVMAGFFLVFLLAVLGLLQDYRLEGMRVKVDDAGKLDAAGWFSLLLPLPLVFALGLAANDMVSRPLHTAPRIVHEAISTGRTYSGDLFELSLERGVNYNAIVGVRDQMSAGYTLAIGEAQLGAANTVVVVAYFDNGAWINCRVTADQLFHCYDASPPFRQGFPTLLTAGKVPEGCRQCSIRLSDEQRNWLQAQGGDWAGPPRVTRLAQWGSYVLMRAESPGGDDAVECLFHGISPVELVRCRR